jgi:Flp pilus assembly protein TadD
VTRDDAIAVAAQAADAGDLEHAHSQAAALVRSKPEDPRLAFILGHCHLKAGRPETAYYLYRYAQKFRDYDGPQLWNQIGMALAEMDREDDAEGWYCRALQRGPTDITYASLASIYTKKGDPRKAVWAAEEALKLNPSSDEAKWNGALALLKLRQWKKGWEWYDSMLGVPKLRPHPPAVAGLDCPLWDGKGGNLLLTGEQGLGDEIMFASMMPEVVRDADRVVLAVDPRLVNLFQRSFPDALVTSRRGKDIVVSEPVELTHRFAMGSLGRLYRNDDGDFPGTPYLKACPDRAKMWRGLLDSLPGKKIGLMWRGGVGGLDEGLRTLDLHEMSALLNRDVSWVSLSHLQGAGAECERFYNQTGVKIHHYPFVHSNDYDDTAALVSQLDAVVTVTATVAHLAGGLGVPCHVLVPSKPQWRYGAEGDSLPWYRSMKLYRQTDHWPFEDVQWA